MLNNFAVTLLAESGMESYIIAIIIGACVLVAAAVIVAVVLCVLSKKSKRNPETAAAEALLTQHNSMHSKHKQLINDYHQHKRLSEEDKRKIDERNRQRGAVSGNPLQSEDLTPTKSEKEQ